MAQQGEYGGFWIRLLALMADIAIMFVASIVIVVLCAFLGKIGPAVASLALLILPSLYWPVMHASGRQATYGKAMLGLKVADLEGNRISFLRSCGRALAWFLSCLPLMLGFVMAGFTARKQALHDFIASTCVVRDGPAHVAGAITVTVVGIVGPMIAIPMFFMALFMGMIASLFGDLLAEMRKFAPQIQIQIPAPKPAVPPKAPATQAPAVPAAPAAPSPALTGNPEQDFDRLVGAPLTGFERPGTTRAGPVILELSTFFTNTFWVKVYMPVPATSEPQLLTGPKVTVNRVLDASGVNYLDSGNTFESKEFFQRVQLSPRSDPAPHLAGIRSVHVLPGLSEQTLQRVEGQINIRMAADPRPLAFAAGETGKEKTVHDAALTVVSISGGTVTVRYRGASENLLTVRAFGADGQPVPAESRQILPENQDVDQEFQVSFKSAPSKVEAVVAAKLIERFYPFSLVRGATAGAPGSAEKGYTVPARPRSAAVTR